jgi:endonuclease-3
MTLKLIPEEEMADATKKIHPQTSVEKVKKIDHEEKIDKIDQEDTRKLYDFVIDFFQKTNPDPKTELSYKNGYELLVAAILSAQTTDKRVNSITPSLFQKYPTIEDLAKASPDDIYKIISSVNYANNKSGYLSRMAKVIVEKYKGKLPEEAEELQNLPGVGRKTANVIAASIFNKPVIAVDTHVFRVAERIGLTTGAEKPIQSEEQLMRFTPENVKSKMSHWLIIHGRYICLARNPLCVQCGLNVVCRYYAEIMNR